MAGKITVDGAVVCEATVTCRLVDLKKAESEQPEVAKPEPEAAKAE
jgi:hypothetical protein